MALNRFEVCVSMAKGPNFYQNAQQLVYEYANVIRGLG